MQSKSRRRVFISYSRRDLDKVEWLRKKLEKVGFDAWLDTATLVAGQE